MLHRFIDRPRDDLDRARDLVRTLRVMACRFRRFGHALGEGLLRLAVRQSEAGRYEEALASLDEAEVACATSGRGSAVMAGTLIGVSIRRVIVLLLLERHGAALGRAEKLVGRVRGLARGGDRRWEQRLATALWLRAQCLAGVGRLEDAVLGGQEAARVGRRVLAAAPEFELGVLLAAMSGWLHRLGRPAEAVEYAREAVVLLRRGGRGANLATALLNLGAALASDRVRAALVVTDEAISIYERLVDAEPGQYEGNLQRARQNRALLVRELGLPAEVVIGPHALCGLCRQRNDGLVAVRHRQVHVRVNGRESCVDERLVSVMRLLWTVCDTRSCCEDDGGRAYVVPAVGQSALAERALVELGFDVVNENGVLYFRLEDNVLRPGTSLGT